MPAPQGAAPDLAETHSSIVFFVGDRAYKLKKALDLGFLDNSTEAARRDACHREVELNRRLAPDVYLGVADVLDVDGEVCDHLVVMRRMPADRRLAHLVTSGAAVDDDLWRLAHLLAAFHAKSSRSPGADEAASVAATRARWRSNTDPMLEMAAFEPASIQLVQALADRYLDGRGPLFEQRIHDGRAVDGHGDLLADDIFCLADGPRVLDCLEFDDRLRLGDGLADAAFLAMDLEHLGRSDLGSAFLDAYREHAGDRWPASLAHHHIAYRALVRAKVTAVRAEQQGGDTAAAGALLELTLQHLDAGRVRLILVGGLPGTGKSTLAAGLGAELTAAVVRSDIVRKDRAGIDPLEPAPAAYGEGLYGEASTDATYEQMLGWAETALSRGETVLLDASWTSAGWRDRARAVAAATHAEVVELRCTAPVEVAERRMARRRARGGDPSDATPEIAAAMAARTDPWPEATTISTDGEKDDARTAALGAVRRPFA